MGGAGRRPLLRKPDAGHRPAVLRGGALGRRRCREGARRRPWRGQGLGQDRPRRTGRDLEQDRRPYRSEPGVAGACRSLGQRQTDPRDAGRRHPVVSRPFPVFRQRHPGPGGLAVADRRRHRRLSLPRAAGRGRTDHPVEFPDPDGHLEAGARAGDRKCRGAQARRADTGVGALPDVADRRSAAARGGQRRQWVWRRSR